MLQVAVTLQGAEGESEPHHLADSEKPVFERGGMDMFLLTTPFSLGELQSVRVWHDNSGEHPAWYSTPTVTAPAADHRGNWNPVASHAAALSTQAYVEHACPGCRTVPYGANVLNMYFEIV